jgi:predicted amidohydrolase YtcJ
VDAEHDTPAEQGSLDPPAAKGISRKRFVVGGAAAGAALGLSGANLAFARPKAGEAAEARGPRPEEDLVLVNGQIHTMDAQNQVVRRVSIRDGRFLGVGEVDTRGRVRVVNLEGRTVVPGLVEPHIHVVSLANRPGYHTPIENATSIAEIQATLAARRPDVPAGQFITALGGWHPNMLAEHRFPTLAELDAAVPDRPVFVFQGFTGPSATNSLGKAFFESASDALAGPVTVGADGSITGGIQSTTALYHLRTRQTFEDKKRSTLDAMAWAARMGLTAMLDQVLFPTPGPLAPTQALSNLDHYRMYDSWLALHREGKTSVRLQVNFLHNQSDPNLPELKERLRNQFQFFGDDMMMTGAIGEWAAPIGAGAVWMEAQRLVAQAGWRNENAVGSVAQLEQVVSAYEAVNAEFGISQLRWMVHHVPFVTTQLLDRLRALGGGVAMRGFTWITGTPTANGSPFRTILDHGIKAGIQGDGVHISTLNPWPHIQYAVTGVNALGVLINGGQQITRQEALRLFTRENAWFFRMEDRIGSIEPGTLADLLVLDKDFFAVPEAEIRKIRPVLTIVDGRVVYDAGVVKGLP